MGEKRSAVSRLSLLGEVSAHVASIGMLPPSPKPQSAVMAQMALKLLGAATRKPKTEVMRQVMLKAHFLPMTSADSPQVKAPTVRPALKAVKMLV